MCQRVMIVDDLPDIRLMLRLIIEMKSKEIVAEATNGAEAVRKYLEHKPDITIMDIDMPVKNGIDASREILAMNRNARIIICSGGVVNREIVVLLEDMGVTRIINKPFKLAQLWEAMC